MVVTDDAEIKLRYERGETIAKIAKALDVSCSTVRNRLKALGVPRRRGRPRGGTNKPNDAITKRNKTIVERYVNGASSSQLAIAYSLSRERICQICRRASVIRSQGRRLSENERNEIKERHREGEAAEALADDFNVCIGTIQRVTRGVARTPEARARMFTQQRKIPADELPKIIKRYRDGEIARVLAVEYDVSLNHIYRLVGTVKKRKSIPKARLRRVLRWRAQGWTQAKIAAQLKCSVANAARLIKVAHERLD